MVKVSVIIPIYNAFKDTTECLDSIIKHGGYDEIIAIDDSSTEGTYSYNNTDIKLIRNPKNLGFVGTINYGMKLAGGNDIIILNSDTIVSKNWIENLKLAAYSRHNIATVTPFSNNATICSYPNLNSDNNLVDSIDFPDFTDKFDTDLDNQYVVLPTCVGFCTYIRNKAYKTIGSFDQVTFGRGYGEENDFSRRAVKLGFINLLDHKTFIHHKGSLSFTEQKMELLKINHQKLLSKHPEYAAVTNQFIENDPIFSKRINISNKLYKNLYNKLPLVLHILHNGPYQEISGHFGGTEIHVRDLIQSTKNIFHVTLALGKSALHASFTFDGVVLELKIPKTEMSVKDFISILKPDLIHAHNAGLLDFKDYREILLHNKSIISLHDFNSICPVSQLFRPDNQTCNLHECTSICGFREREIAVRRETATRILKQVDKILYFSDSTKNLINKALNITDELNWFKLRHPVANKRLEKLPRENPKNLKILILGIITPQKGYYQIKELIEETERQELPISWSLLGKINFKHRRLKNCGSYNREEVAKKINEINPDIVLIASIWPETYCMTLDEAWSAGIPVMAHPIGAPQERIQQFGGGILSEECTSKALLTQMKKLCTEPNLLSKITDEVRNVPLVNFNDSAKTYFELYNHKENIQRDLSPLQPYIILAKKRKTFKEIMRDYVKFKVMFILDYFGIKAKVKAFMTKYSLLDYLR